MHSMMQSHAETCSDCITILQASSWPRLNVWGLPVLYLMALPLDPCEQVRLLLFKQFQCTVYQDLPRTVYNIILIIKTYKPYLSYEYSVGQIFGCCNSWLFWLTMRRFFQGSKNHQKSEFRQILWQIPTGCRGGVRCRPGRSCHHHRSP